MATEARCPFKTVKFIWKLVLGYAMGRVEYHISNGCMEAVYH